MRMIFAAFAAAVLVMPASTAAQDGQTDISRCIIEVDGKVWQDGPCRFAELGDDGSFSVQGKGGKKEPVSFAYVYPADGDVPAQGFWNGTQRGNHAHDRLGDLVHDGACWTNERARVCAWR